VGAFVERAFVAFIDFFKNARNKENIGS